MKKDVELRSPWVNWTSKVRELFKRDPEITMTWSDETLELHMVVDNPVKAMAIRQLLPEKKTFGKVTVKVFVEASPHRGGEKYVPELVKAAFTGNPLYEYQHEWNNPDEIVNPLCWVVMANTIVQYPDDNLNDIYGDRSILPEQLMRDVLDTDLMFYCTRNPDRPIPDGDEPIPDDLRSEAVKYAKDHKSK